MNTVDDRTARILAGTGLTLGNYLEADDDACDTDSLVQTAFNDNDADTLAGSAGLNWFRANHIADNGSVLDKVTDQAAGELCSESDFYTARGHD